MSKIIVPLHFAKLNSTPANVETGFKKFYLRGEWFKLYNGITEIDVVLDRPLDNYIPIPGIITASDTVLTAIEKLDYAIGNINPNVLWGSITGNILAQTDLIAYIAAQPANTLQQVVNAGNGISNFGGIGNASIQSTNFTNNRTLYLNDSAFPTIRIVDNLNASNNLQIDLDTLTIDGVSYNWSTIVNPPASPLSALPFTTDHLAATNNQYVVGDLVWYLGDVYRCLASNDSIIPTSTLYWTNLGAGYPLVQQPADWNSTSGNNQILNKPTIPTTPSLQQVTTVGNVTTDTITVGGITSGNFTSDGFQLSISDNLNGIFNFLYTPFAGLYIGDGFSDYIEITRSSSITFSTSFGSGSLQSDLLTGYRTWKLPDGSGTIPLTVNGQSANLSGAITIPVGTGTVTSVTATSPITSSGGTTPVISTSMATNKLIGRSTAGTGVMEEITVGTGLSLSGGTLNATAQTVGFEQNFLLMGS